MVGFLIMLYISSWKNAKELGKVSMFAEDVEKNEVNELEMSQVKKSDTQVNEMKSSEVTQVNQI